MTRLLSRTALQASRAQLRGPRTVAEDIFHKQPTWMVEAALAALADLRPDLDLDQHTEWLATHLWQWPRHSVYFLGVCRLLRRHDVGGS